MMSDGKEFTFSFVADAVRRVQNALEQLAKNHGITLQAVEQTFEAVSLDLEDLQSALSGKRELLWSPLEDQMLLRGLTDEKVMNKVLACKGKVSVEKRLTYLRNRNSA
eukprot:TRINITY_DN18220_c0_g1_i1.p1 TRINITY_DN18220_c0_g1~~TRINITY_DN18220_c0_g1_i1.p1  ORF type:complete len:108 (-),score=29.95 TRINITY_DN18220_c0_g1_i1:36-359(-)